MLIGEALSVTSGSAINGVIIQYDGKGNAIIKDLALDGTGSYAPTTSGLVNKDNAFISSGSGNAGGGAPQGKHRLAGKGLHARQGRPGLLRGLQRALHGGFFHREDGKLRLRDHHFRQRHPYLRQ